VVFGKKSVHARFCPLSLHCACLFLPLLPASSVCLICLSYLPPLPYLPFLPPLLPLLPVSHGQGRYATPPGIVKTPEINAFRGGECVDPGNINAGVRGSEGGGNAFSSNTTLLNSKNQ
jgi:hypothetical protein